MEDLFMLKETSMRANGWMIKLMDTEFTLIIMEASMKVNGLMISNMVLVLRDGLMVLSMREHMNKE